eukprot:jgi/Picsp_1/5424/NSC_02783-R1_acetolactate catabolic
MPTGADVLVQNLVHQGVERIFTVPGAKIDRVLESLRQLPAGTIEVVLCRNEQSAAFMAAGHGRRTSKSGVVLVTSGPGVANLTTSLVTATCEGDPVVAFGGAVPLPQRLKRTHQSMDNVSILKPVCKYCVEIDSPLAIGEVVANAFRNAEAGRPGASFVSIPMDLMMIDCEMRLATPIKPPYLGAANKRNMDEAADALNAASMPLILCGGMASSAQAVVALRALLASHPIPVISTFQGTGTVSKEMADLYCGRVGLTKNQPADKLLDDADVILAVGYDVIEYDASIWNTTGKKKTIIHLDHTPFDVDNNYSPDIELIGSISETLQELTMRLTLSRSLQPEEISHLQEIKKQREGFFMAMKSVHRVRGLVHPLQIVSTLQALLDKFDDLTYFSDMGSFHIWLSRYLIVHKPRQLVNTNGQQTLGVALPWAMSAAFDAKKRGTDKKEKIISISGDGGFLFSAFELETASRFGLNLVHIIFDDCCYNMVKVQQEKKYGASEAVQLGSVDFVKLAESLGAKGFKVTDAEALPGVVDKGLAMDGPVVIQVMVDYSDNHKLFEDALEHSFH